MAVIGVAMRKLNRAASARSRPANSAADIEMPERLTPGTSASAWATPMPIAPRKVSRSIVWVRGPQLVGDPQDRGAEHEHHGHHADLRARSSR